VWPLEEPFVPKTYRHSLHSKVDLVDVSRLGPGSPGWSIGPLRMLVVVLYIRGFHLYSRGRPSDGLVALAVAGFLPLWLSLRRLVTCAKPALYASMDSGRSAWRIP